MKIALDGNEANINNRVGSGQYAFAMLREFSKDTNNDYTVYLKKQPISDLPPESANYRYKVFGPKKFWTQLSLPIHLMLGQKPDIFLTLGHYGPRISSVPYLITIFDLSYLHYPEMFNKNDLYQLTNWSKYSIKNSKHIFSISNTTKKDIIESYDIDPAKISVTYMGYDKMLFRPQPRQKIEKIKLKYKINGDYIIFIGTLQPRKNLANLLSAFSMINKDLKLVIVGKKGWLYDSIFQKIKMLKIADKIIFTDYVPSADIPPLLAGAKLYILPSLYEGFGIPVIEAQACGTPVVVSNVSSLPEVIGDSGIKIDPNSTESIRTGIEQILNSPKLASNLAKKGLKNAHSFSWQKCAAETLKVVKTINL